MKIIQIQIGKVKIPLKKPFITALRRVDICRRYHHKNNH